MSLQDEIRLLEASWFMSQPHDLYRRLRQEAPVFRSERDGIWAVSRYADVKEISRSPDRFVNGFHIVSAFAALTGDGEPDPVSGMPSTAIARRAAMLDGDGNDSLLFSDGDRHMFLRRIASRAFTPKAVGRLDAEVSELTGQILDQVTAGEVVDFVDMVAAPVPIVMIARMLGVGDEHVDDFRRWSDALIDLGDESFAERSDPDLMATRMTAVREFNDFFKAELRARQDHPRDDLLSAMVEAEWEGRPMTMAEMLMMTTTLLIAGNETTRGLISGAGALLAERPDQIEVLRDNPDLIASAVEEFLRMVSPVSHMCRTAVVDTEISGEKISKGDYVCMLYPAANRDEDVWERADELDVRRPPEPGHVAFGFAEHYCLGAALARREARIVLEQLVNRFTSWDIAGDLTRTRSHITPGILTMPVVLHR